MSFVTDKKLLLAEFPELNDENIILQKEIYAHFGLLFMKFSIVEHSLINIVTFSHVGTTFIAGQIRNKIQWEKTFDEGYEAAVKQTFGNLVKNVIKEPEFLKLEARLTEQKRARDYFAHHFFREEIRHFFDAESSWKTLIAIAKLRRSTIETESELKSPFLEMCARYGIQVPDENQLSKMTSEILEEYKIEVDKGNEPNFGWKPF